MYTAVNRGTNDKGGSDLSNGGTSMQVLPEELPANVCAPKTKKKYLDSICKHFGLKLVRVGGDGNCLFVSCAKVLSCLGIIVDASTLRQQVVLFLRECYFDAGHGVLGERCCQDMEHEVLAAIPLVSCTQTYNGFVPHSMDDYLTATADTSVWACGYHWIRAVASLYSVSIVIVIHAFDHVDLFSSDSAHPRVFLYKTDVETHYDALVPKDAHISNADGLSQNSCHSEAYVSSQPHGPSPSEESNAQPASFVPLSIEELRAARLKALNLQRTAVHSPPQCVVEASNAASSLLTLHSDDQSPGLIVGSTDPALHSATQTPAHGFIVISTDSRSSDDLSDGWTANDAYQAYVKAVLEADGASWDRHEVITEIGSRASFDFSSWRRMSEMERFTKIRSSIARLRKLKQRPTTPVVPMSRRSSVDRAGDQSAVVYTSVFECTS